MSELNLNNKVILKQITDQVKTDIDNFSLTFNDGHRNHLGASLIGHECKRYLWYVFRWVQKDEFEPRMLRLFNRGHREEPAFINLLRGAGYFVKEYDLESEGFHYCAQNNHYYKSAQIENNEFLQTMTDQLTWESENIVAHIKAAEGQGFKFNQLRIKDCKGHFGGSLDGLFKFPEHYGIPGEFLLEFKTNGTGQGFTKLLDNGVQNAKQQHYAQQCVYGYKKNINQSLYLNVCKNDDNLHVEFFNLNLNEGANLIQKAEQIIFSQKPPAKFSLNPTKFECKFCNKNQVCHENKPAEKNCRSCLNAYPVDDGEWLCQLYGQNIPKDFIKVGCDNWLDITKQAE